MELKPIGMFGASIFPEILWKKILIQRFYNTHFVFPPT